MKSIRLTPEQCEGLVFTHEMELPASPKTEVIRVGGVEFPVKVVPKESLPPGLCGYIEDSRGQRIWLADQ